MKIIPRGFENLPALKNLNYVSFGTGGGDPTKWEYFHIINEYAGDNVLTINLSRTDFTSANTEYSFDKETWEALNFGSTTYLTMPEGSTVYLRGTDWVRNSGAYTNVFKCNKNFSLGGCILSLLDYTNMKNITEIPDYFAQYLFNFINNLIKADFNIGNATTVGDSGFKQCFGTCSNLNTAPNFSNLTSVGSDTFGSCFENCTSLTTSPDFSNVTSVGNSVFEYCFYGCSNLNYVYAPSVSEWKSSNFNDWLSGVASTGTMSCPQGLSIPEGTSGIPSGWTRVDR